MKKLAKPIQRIGLIGNSDKVSCGSLITKTARLVKRQGVEAFCDEPTRRMASLNLPVFADVASLARKVDLLLVFGGDGTMLRVATETVGARTPILGINVGNLGFLTAVSAEAIVPALKQIWCGGYSLESRPIMEARGVCLGEIIHRYALNDFVISRGVVSRLITLSVSVDDEPLTRYRCDGLIVSSPTGSTAYSLSAGGAVIHPSAEVFEISPICPHTLSNRSVIVSLNSNISVRVVSPKPETMLSADGQGVTQMAAGDNVTIRRSRHHTSLVRLDGSSFFETLRCKLHWSGANF